MSLDEYGRERQNALRRTPKESPTSPPRPRTPSPASTRKRRHRSVKKRSPRRRSPRADDRRKRRRRSRSRSRSSSSSSSSSSTTRRRRSDRDRRSTRDFSNAEPILSFKEFMWECCPDDVDPEKAKQLYDEYKSGETKSREQIFYEEHRHQEWFMNRYDPAHRHFLLRKHRMEAKRRYEGFIKKLEADEMVEVYNDCPDKPKKFRKMGSERLEPGVKVRVGQPSIYTGQTGIVEKYLSTKGRWGVALQNGEKVALASSEISVVSQKAEVKFYGNSVFIQCLPLGAKERDIKRVMSNVGTVERIVMIGPIKMKAHLIRMAWVTFSSQDECIRAMKPLVDGGLNGYTMGEFFLNLKPMSKSLRDSRIKSLPPISLHPTRVEHDVTQAFDIKTKLDREAGIQDSALASKREIVDRFHNDRDISLALAEMKTLNCLITYLRVVHIYSYYSASFYRTAEEYAAREPPQYDRARGPASEPDFPFPEEPTMWEMELDRAVADFMYRKDPIANPDESWEETSKRKFVESSVAKKGDKKYSCKLCPKLFKDRAFVQKHVSSRHANEVTKHAKTRRDEIAYSNFKSDSEASKFLFVTKDLIDEEAIQWNAAAGYYQKSPRADVGYSEAASNLPQDAPEPTVYIPKADRPNTLGDRPRFEPLEPNVDYGF